MTKNESGENMIQNEIISMLFEKQDIPYRDFQSKLIPTVDRDSVIGVRTPELRALAKELAKRSDVSDFLSALPHRYFDENQLHAFMTTGRPATSFRQRFSKSTKRSCCRLLTIGSEAAKPTPCASAWECLWSTSLTKPLIRSIRKSQRRSAQTNTM